MELSNTNKLNRMSWFAKISLVLLLLLGMTALMHDGVLYPAQVSAAGVSTISDCNGCHGYTTYVDGSSRNVGGNYQGSHSKHALTCTDCHAAQTGNYHADGQVNMTFSGGGTYTKGTFAVANTFTPGSCNGTSCHANVYGATPVYSPTWGNTQATCNGCHSAYPIGTYGPVTGSHLIHAGDACTACHNASTSATVMPATGHIDGKIDVIAGYPTNVAKHAAGSYTGRCSTASCHGNPYGAGSITTPTWGMTVGCVACHSVYPITSVGPATGSHQAHLVTDCAQCHLAGTTASVAPATGHSDGNVDVQYGGYPTNVAKHSTNSYTGRCNTATCHSNPYAANLITSPTWGVVAGCSACHVVYPITSVGPATGSHQAHLVTDCAQCHLAGTTATVAPATGHGDGNVDVQYGGYPTNVAKHSTSSYTGRCNTATCHSNPYAANMITSPTWGVVAGCTACHVVYPITSVGPATGSHQAHLVTDCAQCHLAGTTATVAPATGHGDGNVDVQYGGYPTNVAKHSTSSYTGRCSTASCHSNPYGAGSITSPTWGVVAGCAACHSVYPITSVGPATGSHQAHLVTDCAQCHVAGTTSTVSPPTGHADGSVDVLDGYPANVAKHATGSYTGRCSTASCHSNPYGAGSITSPTWGLTVGCAACHSVYPITSVGPATGSHQAHLVTDCAQCHVAGTTSTVSPPSGHADGNVDVTDGYPTNITKHATGSYTGRCSTASCHSNPYGAGSITSPTWGVVAGCAACHSVYPITSVGPATGSHQAHLVTDCAQCHVAGTTSTVSPPSGHADGSVDVLDGYPANVAKHATGSYTGRCNTASCHSNPYASNLITSPTWGLTVGCAACHVVYPITSVGPATGSHQAHLVTDCAQCHVAGTSATVAPPTGHGDSHVDVLDGYPANVAKHATGSYTGRCNTASCHASPYAATLVTTPTWGAIAGCAACHSNDATTNNNRGAFVSYSTSAGHPTSATGPNTGAHNNHMAYGRYTCDTCHNSGVSSTTTPTVGHADGHVDVLSTTGFPQNVAKHTVASYTNTCSLLCHNVTTTKPNWGSKLGCIDCHAVAITRTKGRAGTVLGAVTTEFGLAWGHKKSGRGAVTDGDCIVCHLEGKWTTKYTVSNTSEYHADGNIDLRDPDGAAETPINKVTAATPFTFARFSTSFATGTRSSLGHTTDSIANVVTQKFCLACHDSNGATNTTARNGATGYTQYLPFGSAGANTTNAAYTTPFVSAGVVGGVVDVKSQFASSNASAHPVIAPRVKDFGTPAKMIAPFNNFVRPGTSGTRSAGVVMNCFDCHNTPTVTTLGTVAAHGASITLRGPIRTAGTTATANMCLACHVTGYTTSTGHGAGSAFSGTASSMSSTFQSCYYCHGTSTAGATVAAGDIVRPIRGVEVHGFNDRTQGSTGSVFTTSNAKPYSFIRNSLSVWAPKSATGVTVLNAAGGGCKGSGGTCSTQMNGATGNGTYLPGGAY